MAWIHFALRRGRVSPATLVLWAVSLLSGVAGAQSVQLITAEGQRQMLADPGTDVAGPLIADVTVIEFFDYNCPYCKKQVPALKALLAEDPKVAVVYKEWPILGAVSVYAASSALATRYQGKYLAAHDALIGGPRLAKNDQVDAILRGAGVNLDTLRKDRIAHAKEISALLVRNEEEARALNLEGTPGLVVGRQFVGGIADLKFLKQLVDNSRRGREGT
jgi:protein-disulfide isomerase